MDRLADHVDLLTGFPFKSASYTSDDSGTRLVRGDNVIQGALRWENAARWPTDSQDDIDRYRLEPGDVVLAMDRPWIEAGLKYARIGQDDVPSLLVQRVACLRARSDLHQGFLFYLIGSRAFTDHVLAVQTGTAVPHISGTQILEFQFRLAPYAEQEAIATVLGALDDKIEQNRRTARALERLARAIFRAWFVDFEPVKAKAERATAFPSMPQEVFDALPASFVDSDIGPVPEGWAVGVISDLASLSKTQVKPQESSEEVFDHFSIPAFDADKRPVVEPGAGIKSNKFLVVEGCVLLSKLNPRIARVWLPFMPSDRRQIASTEFLVFVPRHHTDRHYLYCQFQQAVFREELAQGASGTSNSHQRVRPNDVLQRSIVVPPPSARKGFARIVDPLFALIAASRIESSNLAEMRDYLLPKLLGGQIRVEVAHG